MIKPTIQQSVSKSALISELSNYNLPQFILQEIANKCGSELREKGKISTILDGMNEPALRLLHKIFIDCENDEKGEFSDYRFAVFISSLLRSKIMFDQSVTGESGRTYKVKVAAFRGEGLIAIGENKSEEEKVSLDELIQFNEMVKDLAKSHIYVNLVSVFYGSSAGFAANFREVFNANEKGKALPNKYGYREAKTITLLQFVSKNTNRVFSTSF